jgi:hypothetical protein
MHRYQLFGLGSRKKFIYQNGALRDGLFGDTLFQWDIRAEKFEPAEYRVTLETSRGPVRLFEDETAFWLEQPGEERRALSQGPVRLPDFAGQPRADLLRALHAEILLNILPWGPVPNLFVYTRPWYRDAAMMALCLERTGNVELLFPWIRSIEIPFDHNNRGNAEPDNLGQILYLASLVGGAEHPAAQNALKEAARFRQHNHLRGITDGSEHPVYQTKWMKYGLRKLGLDDPYEIPEVHDFYSSLFWMDYKDQHVPGDRFNAEALRNYPYLNWAEAHFYGEPPPEQIDVDACPLTREVHSSEAIYSRSALVNPDWVKQRWSSPHTWHGAEIFLYFLDLPGK